MWRFLQMLANHPTLALVVLSVVVFDPQLPPGCG
jgi:hypothetical protein